MELQFWNRNEYTHTITLEPTNLIICKKSWDLCYLVDGLNDEIWGEKKNVCNLFLSRFITWETIVKSIQSWITVIIFQ